LTSSIADYLDAKMGLQDYFRPLSVTVLPTRASIPSDLLTAYGYDLSSIYAGYDVIIFAKRLDVIDLGAAEREVQRLACMYRSGDIAGIEDLLYVGQERIYGVNNTYNKSSWASRIVIFARFTTT